MASDPSELSAAILATPSAGGPERLFGAIAELLAARVPLSRIGTNVHHFDPELLGRLLIWERGEGVRSRGLPTAALATESFQGTLTQEIVEGRAEQIRCRLDAPTLRPLLHPNLVELAEAGATDYVIFALDLSEGIAEWLIRRSWISFATCAPEGFRDEDLLLLGAVLPVLAHRLSLEATKASAQALLTAYLGHNAARRILEGAFRRGTGEIIRAVIWCCDMQGFTALGESLSGPELVRVLDGYFECVAAPVDARGGEVLKFIGDAVLGIFPTGDDPAAACRRALDAFADVQENLEGWNRGRAAAGQPRLACGVGLHVGDVMYGNIGARGRLDFTVIGAPVNEATRVEAATRALGVPVVLTADFVAAAGLADAVPLGAHALKGVSRPRMLFTIPR